MSIYLNIPTMCTYVLVHTYVCIYIDTYICMYVYVRFSFDCIKRNYDIRAQIV